MEERLQKLISQAGVASRRKAEALMQAGLVTVNGTIVSELGSKADFDRDHIVVEGKPLKRVHTLHHLLFYKPKSVVTTLSDPEGRPTIQDYVRGFGDRLYPVGRLDFHSEGLLILTNDGELANRVLHASTALPKTYWVKVAGRPNEEQLQKLRRGVYVDGRKTAPAQIGWLKGGAATGRERQRAGVYRTSEDNPWLEVVLIEGRYHQIRKMFLAVGHPVEKLKRVAIGRITIGALKPGAMRPLSSAEVAYLRRGSAEAAKRKPAASSARGTGTSQRPAPRRRASGAATQSARRGRAKSEGE